MIKVVLPYVIDTTAFVSSSIAETEYPTWAIGATYGIGDQVIFARRVWRSLRANNLGRQPTSEPLHWVDRGPNNRWAMLDAEAATSSTATTSIAVVLDVPGDVTDVILTEVVGTSVTVEFPDQTITEAVPAPALYANASTLWIPGFTTSGGNMEITLTGTGTVSIGSVTYGRALEIGIVERSPSVRIIDYSRRYVSPEGSVSYDRRGYAKRLHAVAPITVDLVDYIDPFLSSVNSRVCAWQFVADKQCMVALGYYSRYAMTRRDKTLWAVDLTVESLVLDSLTGPP